MSFVVGVHKLGYQCQCSKLSIIRSIICQVDRLLLTMPKQCFYQYASGYKADFDNHM